MGDNPVADARVFWLSFCDGTKPDGEQFLGACLVSVTSEEVQEAAGVLAARFPGRDMPAEAVGLTAAVRKAHQLGCNPGGEVASIEIDPAHPNLAAYGEHLGVLMDRPTIAAIEAVIARAGAEADA